MSEVLHKNAIITGIVNSFCLVCDCYLKSKKDAHSHIKSAEHGKNLSLYPYLDKFEDQYIRKVKSGYFCQFCNVLLLTAMKVEFHIAEEKHAQKRGAMLLEPFGFDVAFEDVIIEERAWHGLISDVCTICDKEVDDENLHKSDVSHVLNLIQTTVKFGANDAIYRQTDDATIQCLTCNVLLPLDAMSEHFTHVDHLDCYASCKFEVIRIQPYAEKIILKQTSNNVSNKVSTEGNYNCDKKDDKRQVSKEENLSNILSNVSTYQSNNVDVNFEIGTAFCRKCCIDIQLNHTDIEKHIENHRKIGRDQFAVRYPIDIDKNTYSTKPEVTEHANTENVSILPPIADGDSSDKSGTDKTVKCSTKADNKNKKCGFANAKLFAKENHLSYNEQNGKSFCQICQVSLPSSLGAMKEHVQGASHIKKIPAFKDKTQTNEKTQCSLKKQIMKRFVNSVHSLLKLYPEDCLVNGKFCIHQLSFYFIIENSQGLRCLLCEKNINYRSPFYKMELQAHVDHPSHHSKMEAIPVIISLSSEFIREIRPGSFHCGFCNLIISGWGEMENHLKCDDHTTKKAIQTARLHREIAVRLMSPFGHGFM